MLFVAPGTFVPQPPQQAYALKSFANESTSVILSEDASTKAYLRPIRLDVGENIADPEQATVTGTLHSPILNVTFGVPDLYQASRDRALVEIFIYMFSTEPVLAPGFTVTVDLSQVATEVGNLVVKPILASDRSRRGAAALTTILLAPLITKDAKVAVHITFPVDNLPTHTFSLTSYVVMSIRAMAEVFRFHRVVPRVLRSVPPPSQRSGS